jgi:enterochelin esterase-like enzyme
MRATINYGCVIAITGLALLGAVLSAAASAQSQPQRTAAPAAAPVSPEVLPDHRVTLRIAAPMAAVVTVTGDWVAQGRGTGGALAKDGQGVWSITIGPLVPDFYSYSFSVDGVHVVDPVNPLVKPGVRSVDSLFEVPGAEDAFEATVNVPHGELRSVWYYSKALQQTRRMQIYTPPGYDGGAARYPVLYLISGGGDDDLAWSSVGRAGFILDNLIAAGKARPMMVVMPNGNLRVPGIPEPEMGAVAESLSAEGLAARMVKMGALHDAFGRELLQDVLPWVEGHYRVMASRESRAIAGMALGAAETLRVAPSNLDKFAYIGVFSDGLQQGPHATVGPDFEQRNAAFFGDAKRTNAMLKLFWIGVGKDDVTVKDGSKRLADVLARHGIRHEFHETEGGHTWITWRHHLADFAPLLFGSAAK